MYTEHYELEEGAGPYLLEDEEGEYLLEEAPPLLVQNNYLSVSVGDGMSTGERIR